MKMTTKNYTPNTTKIELHDGNLNFFETPKMFATIVDTFVNAKCKVACIDREVKTMIKTRKNLIAEHEKMLNATPDDTKHFDEIQKLKAEIEDIQNRKAELIKEVTATQYTLNTTDENLYWAYKECKDGTLEESEYINAIAVWFNQFGAKAHKKTIKTIVAAIGNRKATNTEIIKSKGKDLTATLKPDPYFEMFYRTVAEMMVKAGTIKEFDFEKAYYTAKDEHKKAIVK